MRQWMLMISLAGFTLAFCGCGGSDQPKNDPGAPVVKPPDVPPGGP